ncbi:hypothetical protein PLEOSDRAFT_1022366, partial [Pleurotus ostreatus PC15]
LSMTNLPAIVIAKKARSKPPGLNAVGIRSLRIKAFVVTPTSTAIHARLDSGADITLMSADYWKSIEPTIRPSLRTGAKIQLQQLTCSASIIGYIHTKIFVETQDQRIVQFDIEAYIVEDMKVPLLLGEDFMTSYKLGVIRKASGQCTVYASGGTIPITASTSNRYRLGILVRKTYPGSTFLQRKQARVARKRPPLIYRTNAPTPVLATKSMSIKPGHCLNVPITLPQDLKESWFIESSILTEDGQDILAAPATLVTPDSPFVPIANPTAHPLSLRKGDV